MSLKIFRENKDLENNNIEHYAPVIIPNTYFIRSRISLNTDESGETAFHDFRDNDTWANRFVIEAKYNNIPTIEEWLKNTENSIKYTYYTTDSDDNPSGNIENIRSIKYIQKTNNVASEFFRQKVKWTIILKYDINDNVVNQQIFIGERY